MGHMTWRIIKNKTPITYAKIQRIVTIFAIRALRPGIDRSRSKNTTSYFPEANDASPRKACETNAAIFKIGFVRVWM